MILVEDSSLSIDQNKKFSPNAFCILEETISNLNKRNLHLKELFQNKKFILKTYIHL